MFNSYKALVVAVCMISCLGFSATLRQQYQSALDKKLRSYTSLQKAKFKIGVAIKNVKTDYDLFDYHGNDAFIPASNNKIFTTLLALYSLPSSYKYETTLYYSPSKVQKAFYTEMFILNSLATQL